MILQQENKETFKLEFRKFKITAKSRRMRQQQKLTLGFTIGLFSHTAQMVFIRSILPVEAMQALWTRMQCTADFQRDSSVHCHSTAVH